jgi:hypothetical protein
MNFSHVQVILNLIICSSISSPVEATSPMSTDATSRYVWTKQGRAESPQQIPCSVQPLAEAFNVSTHVSRNHSKL